MDDHIYTLTGLPAGSKILQVDDPAFSWDSTMLTGIPGHFIDDANSVFISGEFREIRTDLSAAPGNQYFGFHILTLPDLS